MTHAERLAEFAVRSSYEDLSTTAVRELKIRVQDLVQDSLGCAMGALEGEPVRMVREQISEFGGNPLAILIGWVIAAASPPHASSRTSVSC